jgi:hypothetical protein
MTIEQLAERVSNLERQVAQLQRDLKPLQPLPSIKATFGMFADDPEYREIIRLGREYREQDKLE